MESKLPQVDLNWGETIRRRRKRLEEIRTQLVELESDLAQQLAEMNAFEFKLRARIKPLLSRLDELEEQVKELLNRLNRQELDDEFDDEWDDWSVNGGAAAEGEYRYRQPEPAPAPPPTLKPAQAARLKRLYRRLARRFHPDMGVDDLDREYRTQLMMAINAAYAAGDLARLEEIEREPDAADLMDYAKDEEQLARALELEIDRCQRRIEEVILEMETLARHESTRLMMRVRRAEGEGRDLMAELVEDIQDAILRKRVEADVLNGELKSRENSDGGLRGEAFADAVWDLSLDHSMAEDPDLEAGDWMRRRQDRFSSDDDILDDLD